MRCQVIEKKTENLVILGDQLAQNKVLNILLTYLESHLKVMPSETRPYIREEVNGSSKRESITQIL